MAIKRSRIVLNESHSEDMYRYIKGELLKNEEEAQTLYEKYREIAIELNRLYKEKKELLKTAKMFVNNESDEQTIKKFSLLFKRFRRNYHHFLDGDDDVISIDDF